ncbi:MAG: hypothetical protein IPP74_06195 [Alphaproteobacteria bacterium]|nr:hypothetical protein [Alphaproteobacteria bacterium]
MMQLNPHIQRYSWSELTPHRLVMMPLVISVIAYIAFQFHFASHMMSTIYLVLIGLWGGRRACEVVIEEIQENTWDFQRLSSVTPWNLSWGKLLGSTIFMWYGGLCALAIFVLVFPMEEATGSALQIVGAYVMGGLLCHVGSLFFSLVQLQGRPHVKARFGVNAAYIGGLILGAYGASTILAIDHTEFWGIKAAPMMSWYGVTLSSVIFANITTLLLLMWLLLGIYCLLRLQLRMHNTPWYWLAFLIFCMVYFPGFYTAGEAPVLLSSAAFIALSWTYVIAFMDVWDGIRYRKCLNAWKENAKATFLYAVPRWIPSLCVCLVVTVISLIGHQEDQQTRSLILLSMLGFMLRDIAILHYFRLTPNGRSPAIVTLFYLFVLYAIVPSLFGVLHMGGIAKLFIPLKLPNFISTDMTPVVSGYIQAILVVVGIIRKWRQYWQKAQ